MNVIHCPATALLNVELVTLAVRVILNVFPNAASYVGVAENVTVLNPSAEPV